MIADSLRAALATALLAALPASAWAAPAKRALALPPPAPVASPEAARVLAWVATAHDNGKFPYIVIDKRRAALFLFDRKGRFLGRRRC